jgi:hypothetical protein
VLLTRQDKTSADKTRQGKAMTGQDNTIQGKITKTKTKTKAKTKTKQKQKQDRNKDIIRCKLRTCVTADDIFVPPSV